MSRQRTSLDKAIAKMEAELTALDQEHRNQRAALVKALDLMKKTRDDKPVRRSKAAKRDSFGEVTGSSPS